MNPLFRFAKETAASVLPIVLIVFALGIAVAPIPAAELARFGLGGVLVIAGLSLFLLGTELGLVPVGRETGSALVGRRSLDLMIVAGLLIGFLVTVAEPDVQVLAGQVSAVDPSIPRGRLVLMIGAGVGFFVAVGFARVVLGVSYRVLLVGFYALVFVLAVLVDPIYVGVAFDAGGATTGPMTVPFILALGVGVSAVTKGRRSEEDSFGLVGLASIGPILAVLLMGLVNKGNATGSAAPAEAASGGGMVASFLRLVPETVGHVALALGPLALLFAVIQVALLRMPPRHLARVATGFAWAFAGLVLFFVGVNGGFLPVGALVGARMGALEASWLLVPVGVLLGAVVVLAEPAVWVLTDQVEAVSGGAVRKRTLLVALSAGVALAVGIAMLRVVCGLSIWWFLAPGYALALGLSFASPPLFTAIAFDSGGVASGPMSSTFVLAFTLGASASAGGDPAVDAFGVIAMIAMVPLIAIQLLGLVYKRAEGAARSASARPADARK
ncbi:MAG: DUF1538 domain-containing protein [Spirochaetales bacterium]|nr:DUF1538 domain-containing protein [Spirochaetales bacterium]